MKGNIHKKLYHEDKFCRYMCCKHHRLNRLRMDKHAENKAWRAFLKKEQEVESFDLLCPWRYL